MGHVRDRWTKPGPHRKRVRNERWGHGLRWQARWIERDKECSDSFETRDQAEAHIARMRLGGASRRLAITVADYGALWLAEQLHYAGSTRRSVDNRLRLMVLPSLGDMPLGEVTRMDVQRMVVEWAQKWAPRTVHQGYSYLTSMFATAMRDGLIPATPCAGVRLPEVQRRLVQPLTADEVATIADQVRPWYRAMVILGAATGLRGAEMRGLTEDRLVDGDLIVNRQLGDDGDALFVPPKSEAGFRRIAMGDVATRVVEEHLARYAAGPHGLVFQTREHTPIDRQAGAKAWQNAIEGLNRPGRSGWHELRHYHASVLIAAGMSPKAVAERLGHADAAEVLRTYAHLWPADHARMAAVTDADLGRVFGPTDNVIPMRRKIS